MARAQHKTFRSQRVVTGFGTLEVDAEGFAELPEDAAKLFLGGHAYGWTAEEAVQPKTPPKPVPQAEAPKPVEEPKVEAPKKSTKKSKKKSDK